MRAANLSRTPDTDGTCDVIPMPSVPLAQALLTEDDAAAVLALSPSTLKKWRRTRRGPRYYRLGSAVRYKREDLEAFVSESAENPCSPRHNEKGDR